MRLSMKRKQQIANEVAATYTRRQRVKTHVETDDPELAAAYAALARLQAEARRGLPEDVDPSVWVGLAETERWIKGRVEGEW